MIRKLFILIRLLFSNEYNRYRIYEKYYGVKFGNNVRIVYYPQFGSEPYLIEIGDNVTISGLVSFINHDGGVCVFRDEIQGLNVYGRIKIGNNVFIGDGAKILPGVTIGNNVIIGAGSIVTKSFPNDVVIAGVPAKIIESLQEYQNKAFKKSVIITSKDPEDKKRIILNFLNSKRT